VNYDKGCIAPFPLSFRPSKSNRCSVCVLVFDASLPLIGHPPNSVTQFFFFFTSIRTRVPSPPPCEFSSYERLFLLLSVFLFSSIAFFRFITDKDAQRWAVFFGSFFPAASVFFGSLGPDLSFSSVFFSPPQGPCGATRSGHPTFFSFELLFFFPQSRTFGSYGRLLSFEGSCLRPPLFRIKVGMAGSRPFSPCFFAPFLLGTALTSILLRISLFPACLPQTAAVWAARDSREGRAPVHFSFFCFSLPFKFFCYLRWIFSSSNPS